MSMLGGFLGGLGGATVGASIVSLILETRQFDAGLVKAKGRLTTASGQMSTGLNPLKGQLGLIGAAAAVSIGTIAVKAFNESEAAIAQTNAVLKSTKGVAGVTAAEVSRLASQMQKLTTFSDEEVRSAENLLLTFTKISKDIFPEALGVVLDMSTALGQDLKSSSIQLGKALQDPILGMTALRRVGVNFNEAAKETVTRLVESGKQMEAQKFILKELGTEFGGAAKAQAGTFAGQIKILGNQLNDVLEELGRFIVSLGQHLLPVMKAIVPLLRFAANHVDLLVAGFGAFATVKWIIPFLATMTVKLQAFAGASLSAQVASSKFFGGLLAFAGGPIGLTIVALAAVVLAASKVPPVLEQAAARLRELGFSAEEAESRVKPLTDALDAKGRAAGQANAAVERLIDSERIGQEVAEGWAKRQQFAAVQAAEVARASREAGRGVRRFAGLSADALSEFRKSASTSLNFVEASFTDLISASHKSANGILREMRRALRAQAEFAKNSAGFLGEVREDFGPRLETAAQQMVQILAESGREGADEMAALRGASDRQIRQMLTTFAQGREGANRTATRITNIRTEIEQIPRSKTIDIYLNVHASGSGTTASDRNIADALANQLISGQRA